MQNAGFCECSDAIPTRAVRTTERTQLPGKERPRIQWNRGLSVVVGDAGLAPKDRPWPQAMGGTRDAPEGRRW